MKINIKIILIFFLIFIIIMVLNKTKKKVKVKEPFATKRQKNVQEIIRTCNDILINKEPLVIVKMDIIFQVIK